MRSDGEPEVPLDWLVRLRWFFLAGQLVMVMLAAWRLDATMSWPLLSIALGAYAASNLALIRIRRTRAAPGWLRGAILIVDIGLLTTVLAASGGASNPFTVLYLVNITLSAVVLSATWTMAIAALSVAGFGVLFLVAPSAAGHQHHQAGFNQHLQGMWAAFVLATVLTAFFIGRITRWLARQREQIAALRDSNARHARLASLTTLAAGAAHELNSPMGTIAIAAHEANLRARSLPGAESVAEDLALILLEVDRCQGILHRLSARASGREDDDEPIAIGALALAIGEQLGGDRAARVEFRHADDSTVVHLPRARLVQASVDLIGNALDATEPRGRVLVELSRRGDDLSIDVRDSGPEIPDDVLRRIGDPFFTTKQPGLGLGLGVFLVRTFVESRGGTLQIVSTPGRGTCATIRLPQAERR